MGGIVMTNDGNAILREVSFSYRIVLLNMRVGIFQDTVTLLPMELCYFLFCFESQQVLNSSTKKGTYWGGIKYFQQMFFLLRKLGLIPG